MKRRIADLGQFYHFYKPNFVFSSLIPQQPRSFWQRALTRFAISWFCFHKRQCFTVSLDFDSFLSCQMIPTGRQPSLSFKLCYRKNIPVYLKELKSWRAGELKYLNTSTFLDFIGLNGLIRSNDVAECLDCFSLVQYNCFWLDERTN